MAGNITNFSSSFEVSTLSHHVSTRDAFVNTSTTVAEAFNITSLAPISARTTFTWTGDILEKICITTLCTKDYELKYYTLCESQYAYILRGIEFYTNRVSSLSKVILSILLSLIMLTAVGGNSLVVMTFVFNRHMRSVTNVFILSLASSDLLVAFTCVPLDMANELTRYWEFGKFACKLFAFISQFSVACSSLTLCCIAFDRYYAIVHPLRLKFLQTPRRAAVLQATVLLISAASSLAYAFLFDLRKIPVCREVEDDTDEVCVAKHSKAKKVFDVWITPIVLLCGPFIFMSIMYGIICYNLWVQRPIGSRPQKNTDARVKLKRKAIKMLITVVCIFTICRSPLILFNAIGEVNHLSNNISNINWRAYLQCLSLSSACWNPIVYAFMNEKFRTAFTTLLRCRRYQIYPAPKHRNTLRASTESRKTTTQLETPAMQLAGPKTTETQA